METIKRIKRLPGKVIEATAEMLAAWEKREEARELKKQAVDTSEDWDRIFTSQLGDAEAVAMPDGSQVTYMIQKRNGYTVEPAEFRVLRKRKGK